MPSKGFSNSEEVKGKKQNEAEIVKWKNPQKPADIKLLERITPGLLPLIDGISEVN
jgi:hypothetical protein